MPLPTRACNTRHPPSPKCSSSYSPGLFVHACTNRWNWACFRGRLTFIATFPIRCWMKGCCRPSTMPPGCSLGFVFFRQGAFRRTCCTSSSPSSRSCFGGIDSDRCIEMNAILNNTIHILLALALPPLLLGVIGKTKAFFGGRVGPPLLQPYFDLIKLFQKGSVFSPTTTWVFRAGPVV